MSAPEEHPDPPPARKDLRLTFTQRPFSAQYADELASHTGLSKADLYNTAMEILALHVGSHRRGVEYVTRDMTSGRTMHSPALPILLGDILTRFEDHPGCTFE